MFGLPWRCWASRRAAPAQTTLRYKFQEGQVLQYVADTKIKMANDVGGIKIGINVNQKTEMTWTIGKVNSDGAARVGLKIDRMIMEVDASSHRRRDHRLQRQEGLR